MLQPPLFDQPLVIKEAPASWKLSMTSDTSVVGGTTVGRTGVVVVVSTGVTTAVVSSVGTAVAAGSVGRGVASRVASTGGSVVGTSVGAGTSVGVTSGVDSCASALFSTSSEGNNKFRIIDRSV